MIFATFQEKVERAAYDSESHDTGSCGGAYAVSSDRLPNDIVDDLHRVVREVTSYDPPKKPEKRVGFY